MPLTKMIIDQGTDPCGIIGCLRTAWKCSMTGHPWVQVHPQTERVEHMLLNFGFKDEFEQAWRTFVDEVKRLVELSTSPTGNAPGDKEGDKEGDNKGKKRGDNSGTPKGNNKGNKEDDNMRNQGTKKTRGTTMRMLAQCCSNKLRT